MLEEFHRKDAWLVLRWDGEDTRPADAKPCAAVQRSDPGDNLRMVGKIRLAEARFPYVVLGRQVNSNGRTE